MEPFRVGTGRLPVYTMSWNHSVPNLPFNVFTHEQFQTTASLSIHQEQEKFLKKFSRHALVLRSLAQNLREQIFQLYLTSTVLGVSTRTFWFGSMRDLLSRWTSSGTTSGSVWNGSISSLANARPIRNVLVRIHTEPFLVNRALNRALALLVFEVVGNGYPQIESANRIRDYVMVM